MDLPKTAKSTVAGTKANLAQAVSSRYIRRGSPKLSMDLRAEEIAGRRSKQNSQLGQYGTKSTNASMINVTLDEKSSDLLNSSVHNETRIKAAPP